MEKQEEPKNKITLLRTVGVVFSDDEFRITQYIK